MRPELEALIDRYKEWWNVVTEKRQVSQQVRTPLYHYTDMRGMLGIITSGKMWFTSIFHMNDPSELAFGFEIAKYKVTEIGHDTGQEDFSKLMVHFLDQSHKQIFGYFVGSFSTKRDDLSQWRAYADNGRGVAIGFAPWVFSANQSAADLPPADITFVSPVCYDPDECGVQCREAISRALGLIAQAEQKFRSPAEQKDFYFSMARDLSPALIWAAATTKHPAYSGEEETRLLLINDMQRLSSIIETRARGSSLVPYIASSLPIKMSGAITEIRIGPGADRWTEEALEYFLRNQNLPIELIDRSTIPYTPR